MTEIIDLIVIQQLNFDFGTVDSEAGIPGRASGAVQDRKEFLILDRTLVSGEHSKFNELSRKVFRLLRYCVI